eukprot:TRINITY_DN5419_c1_g1_i1.p1 TRINITY_DN5419_c1_g1~~TRINITY_DN5419_c1_g1_i1.p1  ORF type:complete len:475 (+),score=89.56 TRINITY_DN5419_c1_g1_i1:86-1510(+)
MSDSGVVTLAAPILLSDPLATANVSTTMPIGSMPPHSPNSTTPPLPFLPLPLSIPPPPTQFSPPHFYNPSPFFGLLPSPAFAYPHDGHLVSLTPGPSSNASSYFPRPRESNFVTSQINSSQANSSQASDHPSYVIPSNQLKRRQDSIKEEEALTPSPHDSPSSSPPLRSSSSYSESQRSIHNTLAQAATSILNSHIAPTRPSDNGSKRRRGGRPPKKNPTYNLEEDDEIIRLHEVEGFNWSQVLERSYHLKQNGRERDAVSQRLQRLKQKFEVDLIAQYMREDPNYSLRNYLSGAGSPTQRSPTPLMLTNGSSSKTARTRDAPALHESPNGAPHDNSGDFGHKLSLHFITDTAAQEPMMIPALPSFSHFPAVPALCNPCASTLAAAAVDTDPANIVDYARKLATEQFCVSCSDKYQAFMLGCALTPIYSLLRSAPAPRVSAPVVTEQRRSTRKIRPPARHDDSESNSEDDLDTE